MNKPNKYVLIIENCTSGLKLINEANAAIKKGYILSGIFTEFDVMNRNERIYTANKFLPHLNELIERKTTLGIIYGEYDHPDVFDTSLSRVSHTIEKVFYNQEKNRVDGEIRLLNTHWGKEAKALVDDGCPIFVSSRAAGVTESNGEVTVKKLFTYDAVADPGFGSAKMEVKSINESLGFNAKNNFRIYDISDESKINELFNMNGNDFITKGQLNEYSNYLSTEVQKLKESLNDVVKKGNANPQEIEKLAELYDNVKEQQNKVAKYLDYLAEKIQIVVNENDSLKNKTNELSTENSSLKEKLDNSIKYAEYIAEHVDKNIDYSNYIAETLNKNIDFTEYIAEHVNKNIEFSDYLAETLEKNINYSEYLAEQVDNSISYSEYLAENVEKNIAYAEYIAENLDNNIAYSEYIAENLDNNIAYSEYIAENVDNSIKYSEYIAEEVSDTQAYTNYIAESVDNTIEFMKNKKLFESSEEIEKFNMKDVDINSYYDNEDEEENDDDDDDDIQGVETKVEPVQEVQPVQPIQKVQPIQPVQEIQPVQPEEKIIDVQAQKEINPENDIQNSVENQELKVDLVPGATVAVEDNTGEVLSYNPNNGIVVIQVDTITDESQPNEQIIEVHESKVRLINTNINENETSFKKLINNLVKENKKRKASEEKEPTFLQFLTEKNKKNWNNLSNEDKEKVNYFIKENYNGVIYSEIDVLNSIKEALTVKKSFDDILLESIPSTLKPIWNKIDEKYQKSILSSAKLYPNLHTDLQLESFWNSRNLESYININESKKVINENLYNDNEMLSEEYLDKFISKIKNLG
jgi:hypothetical protein